MRLFSRRAVTRPGLPESRAAVQAQLPADTAVLAYFVGDRRSHAWLLTRTGLRHSVLPGRLALERLVMSFVERQRTGKSSVADAAFAGVFDLHLGHQLRPKRPPAGVLAARPSALRCAT